MIAIAENLFERNKQSQEIIYYYFSNLLQDKRKSPSEVIDRFRHLLVEGKKIPHDPTPKVIEKILQSKQAEEDFTACLARCLHLIINRWYKEPTYQAHIDSLIKIFANISPPKSKFNRTVNKKKSIIYYFSQSEEYQKIQFLGDFIQNFHSEKNEYTIVKDLIPRYYYLYYSYLLTESSCHDARKTVKSLRKHKRRQFERNLSQYITYQVRCSETNKVNLFLAEQSQLNIIKNPRLNQKFLRNPSLLTDSELHKSIKHFIGRTIKYSNYKKYAHKFLTEIQISSDYKRFKYKLYKYLISSINEKYGNGGFNRDLQKAIDYILPDDNERPIDQFLIVRTANQLFNFLVVDNPKSIRHYRFIALVTNIGATRTIGLLLKLVLLSPNLQSSLEKKFALLLSHYQSTPVTQVPWLIKSLENLHIAFAIYFNKLDLSHIKNII